MAPTRFRPLNASTAVFVLLSAMCSARAPAAPSLPEPGLYRVEVRIALPNVQDVAVPLILTQCVTDADLVSGHAFAIQSENPLRACGTIDYLIGEELITYRVACPGPNMGYAQARFEATTNTYRGSIYMNMGGKNMTMSETQTGKRLGPCP